MKTRINVFYKLVILLLILISVNVENDLFAAGQEKGSVVIKKCQDFTVSGNGNAEAWKSTGWINIVKQSTDPSTYLTKAKVLYSETGIYFLFDCEDKKLTATLMGDFLDIYNEDVVEVFLWTDESFPVYFEYELSPLDFELPIIVPNYNGKFYGWQPWHYEGDRKTRHATSVNGGEKISGGSVSGWMAEFFIPYKLLVPLNQVPPVSGTKWRANMYRIDYDNTTTHFSWQKVNRSFHDYNNYGTFIFE